MSSRSQDPQQPNAQLPDEWRDPFPQHEWTLNRTALAVTGETVRPEEDQPCEGPFPCEDSDNGRIFRGSRMETITLHPARGRDLINEPGTENKELCRHHYGTKTINERGRIAPVMFSLPDNARVGGFKANDFFASVGFYTVGDDTDRPPDDLLSLCGPGRMCGVVAFELPETIEGLFDSHPVTCGILS